MRTRIKGGRIVNEGRTFEGAIVIEDERIVDVIDGKDIPQESSFTSVVDAKGCYVLPGIIDTHVHFLFAKLVVLQDNGKLSPFPVVLPST